MLNSFIDCKNTRHTFRISKQLDFCPHISEKYSNIKFHENSLSGIPAVAIRKTDMKKVNTRTS